MSYEELKKSFRRLDVYKADFNVPPETGESARRQIELQIAGLILDPKVLAVILDPERKGFDNTVSSASPQSIVGSGDYSFIASIPFAYTPRLVMDELFKKMNLPVNPTRLEASTMLTDMPEESKLAPSSLRRRMLIVIKEKALRGKKPKFEREDIEDLKRQLVEYDRKPARKVETTIERVVPKNAAVLTFMDGASPIRNSISLASKFFDGWATKFIGACYADTTRKFLSMGTTVVKEHDNMEQQNYFSGLPGFPCLLFGVRTAVDKAKTLHGQGIDPYIFFTVGSINPQDLSRITKSIQELSQYAAMVSFNHVVDPRNAGISLDSSARNSFPPNVKALRTTNLTDTYPNLLHAFNGK